MGLISLTCPNCGGQLSVDDTRDEWFCNFCGTKVIKDKQYIEISGNVSVNGIATADSMLERAYMEIHDGHFPEAAKLLDRVLDAEPRNWRAYLGRMMCQNELTSEDELSESLLPLSEYDDFNKAVQFAPDEEATRLKKINASVTASYVKEKAIVEEHVDKLEKEIAQRQAYLSTMTKKNSTCLRWYNHFNGIRKFFLIATIIGCVLATIMTANGRGIPYIVVAAVMLAIFIAALILRNLCFKYTMCYKVESDKITDIQDELNGYKYEHSIYF